MIDVSIRAMEIADYAGAFGLWARTESMALGQSDTEPAIAAFLKRNRSLSAVAVLPSGEVVGTVLCGHDGRRGYLHHVAVASGHRRKRVATRLVAWCLERLAGEAILKCNICLFADNGEGATFWRHAGWSARRDLRVFQKIVGCP